MTTPNAPLPTCPDSYGTKWFYSSPTCPVAEDAAPLYSPLVDLESNNVQTCDELPCVFYDDTNDNGFTDTLTLKVNDAFTRNGACYYETVASLDGKPEFQTSHKLFDVKRTMQPDTSVSRELCEALFEEATYYAASQIGSDATLDYYTYQDKSEPWTLMAQTLANPLSFVAGWFPLDELTAASYQVKRMDTSASLAANQGFCLQDFKILFDALNAPNGIQLPTYPLGPQDTIYGYANVVDYDIYVARSLPASASIMLPVQEDNYSGETCWFNFGLEYGASMNRWDIF